MQIPPCTSPVPAFRELRLLRGEVHITFALRGERDYQKKMKQGRLREFYTVDLYQMRTRGKGKWPKNLQTSYIHACPLSTLPSHVHRGLRATDIIAIDRSLICLSACLTTERRDRRTAPQRERNFKRWARCARARGQGGEGQKEDGRG